MLVSKQNYEKEVINVKNNKVALVCGITGELYKMVAFLMQWLCSLFNTLVKPSNVFDDFVSFSESPLDEMDDKQVKYINK